VCVRVCVRACVVPCCDSLNMWERVRETVEGKREKTVSGRDRKKGEVLK